MATTIRQTESAPAAYPEAPDGLSEAAQALDPDMIWQRLESYIACRWTERAVIWVVEGCGEWHPPLAPATITKAEIWRDGVWVEVEPALSPSPYGGYVLPGDGPYRFTATVGGGSPAPEVPAAAEEAFRRLAEYMAADKGTAGASSESTSVGPISISSRRSPSWIAQAMQNSGAGDLLRPYRRV
ncbi:hypothetical protein NYR54_01715 [Chelativorans sp. SCAU2101]|uniref:Uncharacterized protein n=1 Tax=Chelativorans petroleitrophicus TaxID=2975484 RepID=A0A9X2X5N1_9HYPH|nr:hypothetical protein [Chelativorans petroleitrophicus]MCT8989013.1 hypothetical protein [Chelativorans petroleitrophicus]